eukprot:CAMPEP_0114250726 /NCGR_PEP_ID=MMETSP0058-20121206/14861_1 /TAXON_ID=36894 /ORGANISM="Pyramimonas parkeae, CCMP726" /LENGTH=71 /DNA_ID=CAMNT_0001364421 /DNA_START=105 /DNA_END=320 /DNA_ORIENTATION=-
MTFFEAVTVREQLAHRSELVSKLGSKYVQSDGRDVICAACKMYLAKTDNKHVAEHFAFSHTSEMMRMLKDD